MPGYGSYWNHLNVTMDDLIIFAWSAPMRDLAPGLEMSDVGLRKLLSKLGVPLPPQGYWNKIRAGRPVPKRPTARPRRPGESGTISLDDRFKDALPPARPLLSTGPFATASVPEDLKELKQQELKAIGRVTVPKTLTTRHPGLTELVKKEQRRLEKYQTTGWDWHKPIFDDAVSKRTFRIYNSILLTLSKRGHDGSVYESDQELKATVKIGDSNLGLCITIIGAHGKTQRNSYQRRSPSLPASTPLQLSVTPDFDRHISVSWSDDDDGKLEGKIAIIAASLIAEGEAKFRTGLRKAEEAAEKARQEAEEQRRQKLVGLNKQRIENLKLSGELLRQAQDIRALVGRVREAINNGDEAVDELIVKNWEAWALGEADKIDPILSGQFKSHLDEPSL